MNAPRFAAVGVFAAVAALLAFYGAYFVRALAPLATELEALALRVQDTPTAYAVILKVWAVPFGTDLASARVLSLVAGVAALVLLARVSQRLSGDAVLAAWSTLAFVLFPPLVAVLAAATPHALVILLSLAALDLMLSAAARPTPSAIAYAGLAGLCCSLAMLLYPLGAVLMPLWLALCAVLCRDVRAGVVALVPVMVMAAVRAVLDVPVAGIDLDLAAAGHDSVFKALVLPYAMVPVTTLLGALAMGSRAVRERVDVRRGLVVLAAPLVAAAVLIASLEVGRLLTAAAAAAPFFLLTSWPLITWIRTVMPGIKSLLAWIVFPVVMYSCFWVILGPVNPDRFPYSHRQAAQPGLPAPRF